MTDWQDIISDAEIARVHGNANFGGLSPRAVVNETVLKYAFGYDTGHTAECIVCEHGLASRSRSMRTAPRLTKKGLRYLRAIAGDKFSDLKRHVSGDLPPPPKKGA